MYYASIFSPLFTLIGFVYKHFVFEPIYNLLTFIYAVLPGHNFGLALMIFTLIAKMALWPMVKKQLHQAKAMRALQPELKKLKKNSTGDKQEDARLMMELYKERNISPVASIKTLFIQLPILLALNSGVSLIVKDKINIVDKSYPIVQQLPQLKAIKDGSATFDNTLLGVVDLTRAPHNGTAIDYWPAFVLVVLSAAIQYLLVKQTMPTPKNGRKLRDIMKEAASSGQQAEQEEVTAAVNGFSSKLIPLMLFVFGLRIASALSFYWFFGGLITYLQQRKVLAIDSEELMDISDKVSIVSEKSTSEKSSKSQKLSPTNKKSLVSTKNSETSEKATMVKRGESGTKVTIRTPGSSSNTKRR
jgi:YidC/Oxa1 family membrane protein insertase